MIVRSVLTVSFPNIFALLQDLADRTRARVVTFRSGSSLRDHDDSHTGHGLLMFDVLVLIISLRD